MSWLAEFLGKALRMVSEADSIGQTRREVSESSDSGAPISADLGEFDPDRAISPEYKEDRLGFRSIASSLASSLLTKTTSHGFVVSIEGVWGSGKSSLVNLLADELTKNGEQAPEIVRFEPWLVGDRDGMLVELMSDLASAVEAIEVPEKGRGEKLKEETKKLAEQLRKYGLKLSRGVAPIAHFAGIIGLPGGELVGKTLEGAAKATAAFDSAKPLPEFKGELSEGLRKLRRRIVVIIDDLDRLEPREAAEIMRLIKAVADFPNIIYILCYDQDNLANGLQKALSVDDGRSFLNKIVQVRFKVPQPEAFDLRRWFLDECLEFYNSISRKQLQHDELERLQRVCSVEGELLKTPRDIVRVINAIKLYWPPIFDKVCYTDLVWLQMVKFENENLYSWIEHYLVECAAVSEGASVNEIDRIALAKKLRKYVKEGSIGSARSMWTFKDFVPGIQPGESVEDKDRLFNLGNKADFSSFERDRRLGSPHHSRYYFAFSKPAGALEDTRLYSFISSAQAGENLEDHCRALIQERRPQGGTKFEVLIGRLNNLSDESLSDNAIPSILKALANHMDEDELTAGRGHWGVRWAWNDGRHLFEKLIARLRDDQRNRIISETFASGKAIGWLMCELIRSQIFAHGRYGDHPKSEESWVLSKEELDEAIKLLLGRFKSTDRERIIDTPEVLSLMYGWMQADDEVGVLEWVREQQTTDAGFLKLLSACRGWMASDKTYYPLNRRDLKHFMDFDEALERLKGISKNTDRTQDERTLAEELITAAEQGKED